MPKTQHRSNSHPSSGQIVTRVAALQCWWSLCKAWNPFWNLQHLVVLRCYIKLYQTPMACMKLQPSAQTWQNDRQYLWALRSRRQMAWEKKRHQPFDTCAANSLIRLYLSPKANKRRQNTPKDNHRKHSFSCFSIRKSSKLNWTQKLVAVSGLCRIIHVLLLEQWCFSSVSCQPKQWRQQTYDTGPPRNI